MEESAYKILIDYAKEHSYEYFSDIENKKTIILPRAAVARDKFVVFKLSDKLIYRAIDEYSNPDSYGVKSAVYKVSDFDNDTDVKVCKKDIFDRFKIINKKIGKSNIDRHLSFKSSNKTINPDVVNLHQTNMFLSIEEKIKPLRIVFKFNYLKHLKDYQNKMIIGIETNNWLYKSSEIDYFINKSIKLLNTYK